MRLGLPRVGWKWSPSSRPAPCAPKRNGFMLRPRSDGSRIRLGLSFDLILLSAVWMHVPTADRTRAFRKLVTLLKPGGCLATTLRPGPAEPERSIYAVSQAEIERLSREHGAFVEIATESKDELGRGALNWTQLVVRLPDDGTGALALLRQHGHRPLCAVLHRRADLRGLWLEHVAATKKNPKQITYLRFGGLLLSCCYGPSVSERRRPYRMKT